MDQLSKKTLLIVADCCKHCMGVYLLWLCASLFACRQTSHLLHFPLAAMIGGAWGGVVVRWGVGYVFHGFCLGYCTYVLAVKPSAIAMKNYVNEKFPEVQK